MDWDEFMEKICELLDADDTESIDDLVEENEDIADEEEIFREAIRRGASDYVRCHADDMDLNDFDVGSGMLAETDDPEIREILINAGAVPDPSDFGDCRLYYDSSSEELETDGSLETELREKLLAAIGMTQEQFTDMLRDVDTAEENLPAPLEEYTYAGIQSIISIADEDDIGEDVDILDSDPIEMIDLLSKLGFDVCEEGLSGAHGHGGWVIYYIK